MSSVAACVHTKLTSSKHSAWCIMNPSWRAKPFSLEVSLTEAKIQKFMGLYLQGIRETKSEFYIALESWINFNGDGGTHVKESQCLQPWYCHLWFMAISILVLKSLLDACYNMRETVQGTTCPTKHCTIKPTWDLFLAQSKKANSGRMGTWFNFLGMIPPAVCLLKEQPYWRSPWNNQGNRGLGRFFKYVV